MKRRRWKEESKSQTGKYYPLGCLVICQFCTIIFAGQQGLWDNPGQPNLPNTGGDWTAGLPLHFTCGWTGRCPRTKCNKYFNWDFKQIYFWQCFGFFHYQIGKVSNNLPNFEAVYDPRFCLVSLIGAHKIPNHCYMYRLHCFLVHIINF